jgi:SanA protein
LAAPVRRAAHVRVVVLEASYRSKGGPSRTMMIYLITFLAVTLGASAALSSWLRRSTRSRTVRSLSEPPTAVRIVVLGCRPRLRSGNSNCYLVERVASAAAAYHHTAGRQILCSGRADEAIAMTELLELASVPPEAIDLDENSNRTIDSIDFLATHHAKENILLVTQPFHMSRSLFLARWRGLDAWGLIAGGPSPGLRARCREKLAELRAIIDCAFGRRRSNC